MFFVDSNYNEHNGISTAYVQHRGKIYGGKAYLHPEDEVSKFTGCRYAEIRAEINALKAEYREKKASCEECRKFVSAVLCYKNFDKESPTAKVMFRQLNRRIKEVNKIAEDITKAELKLMYAIKTQEKFKEKIKSKND